MSGAPEPDRGAIAFAEKLMTVLAEGGFTGTYKYGVLLALIDLCLECSTRGRAAPARITVSQLAAKTIELYWGHTLPYPASQPTVLKQNVTGQMELLTRISEFRSRDARDETGGLTRARMAAPAAYDRLVREIEWKLAEMPLPRLQRVGHEEIPFLYKIAWNRDIRRSEYFALGRERSIEFVGEAAEHLVRLAGLLRPMIQREWARFVADRNPELFSDAKLEDFLFGPSRASLAPVREVLRDLGAGRCFYCERPLEATFEVDHFVPWSRYPDNGIENLVAADRRCNNSKRQHLAAAPHVERWIARAGDEARADTNRIGPELGSASRPDERRRALHLSAPSRRREALAFGPGLRADRPAEDPAVVRGVELERLSLT
jgi:5-methylcytosine-specific restriction endonuclease McrA